MPTSRICAQCAQPIEGRYINALDADWHPEHFCCAVCQKPITETPFYIHEGQPCHPACYEDTIAVRCTVCAKPLTGKHQINYWGDRFCLDHGKEHPSCPHCGRLVSHATKRTRRRSVEPISCAVCESTAIVSEHDAQPFLPERIAWLEAQGMRFRPSPGLQQKKMRLEVLDRADFMERNVGKRDPLGLTLSKRFMRNKKLERVEIEGVAILRGLPETLFLGILVHELVHVWLIQQSIVNLPLMDEEGLCELLSYFHYVQRGSEADLFYAERIAKNSSPIYGDGFRKLKKLEERVGFAQIVKSLLRKKKLPL